MAFSREKVKRFLLYSSKYIAIKVMKYKSSVTDSDAPHDEDIVSSPVSIYSHVSGARRKLNHISRFMWVLIIQALSDSYAYVACVNTGCN